MKAWTGCARAEGKEEAHGPKRSNDGRLVLWFPEELGSHFTSVPQALPTVKVACVVGVRWCCGVERDHAGDGGARGSAGGGGVLGQEPSPAERSMNPEERNALLRSVGSSCLFTRCDGDITYLQNRSGIFAMVSPLHQRPVVVLQLCSLHRQWFVRQVDQGQSSADATVSCSSSASRRKAPKQAWNPAAHKRAKTRKWNAGWRTRVGTGIA